MSIIIQGVSYRKIEEKVKFDNNTCFSRLFAYETGEEINTYCDLYIDNVHYKFVKNNLYAAKYINGNKQQLIDSKKAIKEYNEILNNIKNYNVVYTYSGGYDVRRFKVYIKKKTIKCDCLLACEKLREMYPDYKILYEGHEYPMN